EIDGFKQADLNAFAQHFSLPSMTPTLAAGSSDLKVEGEAELDLEVAHEIAPGARLVVYNCSLTCSTSDMLNLETRAVQATAHGIISISLGGCESAEGSSAVQAENNVFAQADALGESVLVASGDSGAYTCLEQDWGGAPSPQAIGVSAPASEPSVTAVGGTSLDLHANSTWYREEAWQNAAATAGSGGGISQYFARPSWQRGPGVVNFYDTTNHREVPDISADADPLTGAQVVISGQLTQVGGTSQATPIWAGMMALIDQYLRQQGRTVAGFLNPALYALAANRPTYPPFHDITVGDNLVYPATPGYNLATGLGTPDAWNLARDLAAYAGGAK
ncbi:MAG: S53 family peptidase, partial [Chloroflexi bacterium]|nr:S53 family peptidase [Chloroflexota bacterium]